jgi:hypothetical protein
VRRRRPHVSVGPSSRSRRRRAARGRRGPLASRRHQGAAERGRAGFHRPIYGSIRSDCRCAWCCCKGAKPLLGESKKQRGRAEKPPLPFSSSGDSGLRPANESYRGVGNRPIVVARSMCVSCVLACERTARCKKMARDECCVQTRRESAFASFSRV